MENSDCLPDSLRWLSIVILGLLRQSTALVIRIEPVMGIVPPRGIKEAYMGGSKFTVCLPSPTQTLGI